MNEGAAVMVDDGGDVVAAVVELAGNAAFPIRFQAIPSLGRY